MTRPLWNCPKCGAKLLTSTLSHSCGDWSVEEFLAGRSDHARALFEHFVALIATIGPYHLAPAKTHVAFLAQVRFASVNRVSDAAIDIHLVLPRLLASSRFRRVEHVGNCYVHHMRLTGAESFDAELSGWLRASNAEYGKRDWLQRSARG